MLYLVEMKPRVQQRTDSMAWHEILIVIILVGLAVLVVVKSGRFSADYQQGSRFKHPLNEHTEKISSMAMIWVLLFGPIYWAVKGVWSHAIIQLVLYFFVIGFFVHFIYPFFARSILRNHYLKNGWKEL